VFSTVESERIDGAIYAHVRGFVDVGEVVVGKRKFSRGPESFIDRSATWYQGARRLVPRNNERRKGFFAGSQVLHSLRHAIETDD